MPRAQTRSKTGPASAKSDRRSEILAAAQRCFVRAGFHGASMQDICNEAGMSPGNLYRYFPSKEALIAGIAERDRAEVAQEFASADLSRGFFAVLEGMAYHHFSERLGRAGQALHRDHVGGAPPSGDRAHLGRVRRRREEMADRISCAPAPTAATSRAISISTPRRPC